jgi:hypothetical protein
MSEHKHTPGPWFRDQHGHIYGWEPTEYGKRSVTLIDNRHSEATSADKNLIAAAPELLEALKKLCADCDGDNLGTVKAPRWAVLCAAETAIAKATGGEA